MANKGDKRNGSSVNGSGWPHGGDDKIVPFPGRKKAASGNGKVPAPSVPFLNLSKIPVFTRTVLFLILAIQVGLSFLDEGTRYQLFYTFGFVPAYFSGAVSGFSKWAYLGPLSHMFIHAGWMHTGFNMVTALTFGILFERAFGTRQAAIFWFVCGLAGAAVYFILNPTLASPVIGASGSISGLFAAAILYLHDQKSVMGMGFRRGPWPLLAFWVAFMAFTGAVSGDNTAWQAHIGGFLCGAGLYYIFRAKMRGRS